MPDGTANPLFTTRRYGAGAPAVVLSDAVVALTAMNDARFTGGSNDVPPGFGGPVTTFNHFGNTNGGIEALPHNPIHVAIGRFLPGTDPQNPLNLGLMTNPDTAGLDPIFWLHHCNIDRLWTQWLMMRGHTNSLDKRWRSGPADRAFVMPKADGSDWNFIPFDVINTSKAPLSYRYDDQPPLAGALVDDEAEPAMEAAMTEPQEDAELIGSSEGKVQVGAGTKASVTIDAEGAAKVQASFAAAAALTENAPSADRVYLKLEGIKASSDAAIYNVYVDLPDSARPQDHPERLAGTVALFGVTAASDPAGLHAGNGVNQVIDITDIVSRLGLTRDKLDHLSVRFEPDGPAEANAAFSIDRIGVYRLGA